MTSNHFSLPGKPASLYDVENPDWAPTVNMGHNKIKVSQTPASKNRAERASRRSNKRQSSTTTQTTKKAKNGK